ncbi:MAG: hypothetical protein WCK49_06820 [Myxococcaceae bacterium]
MITVAIVSRRLKEGKTYEDFRKAWFHTVGFGSKNKMFSLLNASDPREVVVIGLIEMTHEDLMSKLMIDVKERLANPLDEVIEPEINRKFGLLVAEDNFSATGSIAYQPAAIDGKPTDLTQINDELVELAQLIAKASAMRDSSKKP